MASRYLPIKYIEEREQMKKRFLAALLCLCLAVGLLPATALAASWPADDAVGWTESEPNEPEAPDVSSISTTEAEPNDTLSSANGIPDNDLISGSLSAPSDEDWFVFQVPGDGYLSITFDHDFVDSASFYWETAFFTSDNKQLSAWQWRGNATTADTTAKIGVPAGTYYLRVQDRSFSPVAYRFTVNYVTSDTWEKEFNETIVTANQIPTDTEISGSIRDSSDADWFAFQVPHDGYLSITFGHDFVDSASFHWETALYTSENKQLNSWQWRGNATTAETTDMIGVPEGTYYLCVKDRSFSPETYRFTVNYTPSNTWEKEFNETIVTANLISTGEQISGSVMNSSDVDWYSFELPEDGTISLTFEHDFVDSASFYWVTSFYTSANKELNSWQWRGNTTAAETTDIIGVPAGTYYLRLEDRSFSSATYRFTVNFGQGEDTPTSVPASGISLNRSSLSLTEGGSAVLTATVTPADATDKTVQWLSSNTKAATVQGGRVTAVGVGSAVITASCADVSAYCVVTVAAKESPVQPSGVHFARVNTYFQDQFTDVPANQWYTGSVAEAFELGLMRGSSQTTFDPYGDVTIAEAVTMAARIHSIYTRGFENFQQTSGSWYQVYLDYAYQNGIIGLAYYNCDVSQRASRAQFAEILAGSMPAEGLAAINDVADGAIPDVAMEERYAEYVYTLYRAGILTGNDASGAFSPSTYITRAEAAAIVSRMAESDNRQSITLSGSAGNRTDSRYLYIVDDCSWTEAFVQALAAGGHLACIESRQEYNTILSGIRAEGLTNVQFRVGARRAPNGTGYYWVDENNALTGEEISSAGYWAHSEWFAGEPSFQWDTHSEEYLMIYFDSAANRWGWNDVADEVYTPGEGRYGYIVEFQ